MKPDYLDHLKRQAQLLLIDLGNGYGAVVQTQAAAYPLGVDLSAWQGVVDFAKLATKVQFAYLRAGYGNDYIDPRLNEYRAGCRANGIKFGLYWYAKPGKDAIKHAQNFWVRWQEEPGDLPPCFDLEESGGLGKSALDSWLAKMYNKFGALSGLALTDMMTYTRASFLDRYLGQNGWLKYTQLWVAHWGTDNPIIPIEWAKPGFTWTVHQYSAKGTGADYGVSSRFVDLDRAKFDIPIPPPPPGDEMKYRVLIANLRIRSEPSTDGDALGYRTQGEVLTPVDTTGDASHAGTYWVKDALGWSAAQYQGAEYMEPFV